MKFIMRYKWLLLFLLIIILITIFFFKYFWFYNSKSEYGNRLEGIEDVPITEDLTDDVVNSLVGLEEVLEAKMRVKGKIINILFDVDKDVKVEEAKTIATNILTKFSDDQKGFYDMQIFIIQDTVTDNKNYPLIGYKNKVSEVIVWSGV